MLYDELAKRLREEADCPDNYAEDSCLMREAADAIEERDRHILTLQHEMIAEAESHIAEVNRLNKQIEVLSKMEKATRWIPVTERLPEDHIRVLVVNDDAKFMVAERAGNDWWYQYFAYDVDHWDDSEQGAITHWQPLPEPPKEE